MAAPRVLISGASIAGPALAWWLHRAGWEPVVVERAPELRTGGQNVDVRGAGREVLRRMELEDAALAATTGEQGTRFVRQDNSTIAEFPAATSDTAGPTAELEILRGDLARLLVERTDGVEYRFGDRIRAVHDSGTPGSGDGVQVSFDQGADESFDLVVAADGIGSSTRRLVFGDEAEVRSLGMETTYGTIPRTDADDDWWRWCNAVGGRSMTLRPDNVGTIRATLNLQTDKDVDREAVARRTPEEHRAHLRERFGDAGWEVGRILDGFDTSTDLYVESIGQVHAPRWSKGRVALVGDAGYCASPVSGMGTSLALVGAYVLAGELTSRSLAELPDALAAYERVMRPYVDQAQDLPPGTPRVANPMSRAGVALFRGVLTIAGSSVVRKLGGQLVKPPAEKIELPDYAMVHNG